MDEIMKNFAVEDESWVLFGNLAPKSENKAWVSPTEPSPTVVRPKLTNKKVMLLFAFTGDGKVAIEAKNPGETVSAEIYMEFIRGVGEKWKTLRSSPTRLRDLWWMHDNARPHVAAHAQKFLTR